MAGNLVTGVIETGRDESLGDDGACAIEEVVARMQHCVLCNNCRSPYMAGSVARSDVRACSRFVVHLCA